MITFESARASTESRNTPSGECDVNARFRAKREQLERFYEGLVPESQGQNLALTVLYVPCSLDSGLADEHPCLSQEQLLHCIEKWFLGGHVFKARRLLYHSSLGRE